MSSGCASHFAYVACSTLIAWRVILCLRGVPSAAPICSMALVTSYSRCHSIPHGIHMPGRFPPIRVDVQHAQSPSLCVWSIPVNSLWWMHAKSVLVALAEVAECALPMYIMYQAPTHEAWHDQQPFEYGPRATRPNCSRR